MDTFLGIKKVRQDIFFVCGGPGSGNFNGGSNGTDGEGQYGGHGRGSLNNDWMKQFVLRAGEGGHGEFGLGGGGGGVLVDGEGPERASPGQGEGYGGGGRCCTEDDGSLGLPGVVLIEVETVT